MVLSRVNLWPSRQLCHSLRLVTSSLRYVMASATGRCVASFILGCCSVDSAKTAFDSLYPPSIDAYQYMERLRELLEVTEEQMGLARLYLERLARRSEEPLAFSAVHRLLGTAVVLAHKFDTDFPYSERTYAGAVGVAPKDLNLMQLLFLKKIDYRLMYPVP